MIVVGERGWCPRPFLVWSFQAPTKEGKERKERKKKIDDTENAELTEVFSSIVEIRFFFVLENHPSRFYYATDHDGVSSYRVGRGELGSCSSSSSCTSTSVEPVFHFEVHPDFTDPFPKIRVFYGGQVFLSSYHPSMATCRSSDPSKPTTTGRTNNMRLQNTNLLLSVVERIFCVSTHLG